MVARAIAALSAAAETEPQKEADGIKNSAAGCGRSAQEQFQIT
jgi:hypothetical protein